MDNSTQNSRKSARSALLELDTLRGSLSQQSTVVIDVRPSGQEIVLSQQATQVLGDILDDALRGEPSADSPIRRITTQQAARILGVSRPFVVKLLDRGEIPFERLGPSRHRRVTLGDVLEYQSRMQQVRRSALEAMAQEAAASGLYDETA